MLLITLNGADRPGLVQKLSDIVAKYHANWEQSRMLHLSGRFVGILEVHVLEDKAHGLIKELRELGDLELTIAEGSVDPGAAHFYQLEVVGADAPGIVSDVFAVVAGAGANVESLNTGVEAAPDSGIILFRARARLGASISIDLAALRSELEAISDDLVVTLDVDSE
ncbi:glycine cleavage system protein R [Rubellicoccus peritrichatus]|uniref:ACT domain-containing protein n=1 Tax=Rubellicoccus peritrichatus TaxID=3080537 RepID=A0AAQ3LHT3_9BACT|nr:ACT domain-containing protein [Puniceicoccus sp. CR14]WOO42334.1 ACT domain-containing protein [Puniceicoccus sp. CR14]